MTSDQRIQTMRERLTTQLEPSHLEIIDDSAHHVGHAGAQGGAGHYTLIISSNQFAGKMPIACHRLVYAAIGDLMDKEIHALRISIV